MVENDDAEFLAEMRGDFLENVPNELEDCEACLLKFEKAGDPAEIAEFKRFVHSMKGGARMVALNEFSNHLHALENKLAKCGEENRMKEFVKWGLPWLDLLRSYVIALRDDASPDVASAKVTQALAEFD